FAPFRLLTPTQSIPQAEPARPHHTHNTHHPGPHPQCRGSVVTPLVRHPPGQLRSRSPRCHHPRHAPGRLLVFPRPPRHPDFHSRPGRHDDRRVDHRLPHGQTGASPRDDLLRRGVLRVHPATRLHFGYHPVHALAFPRRRGTGWCPAHRDRHGDGVPPGHQ